MTDEPSRIDRFYRENDVRFVLCHDDGTEITDVPPNKVEEVSERCRRSRIGLVKRIVTPRAETPPPAP